MLLDRAKNVPVLAQLLRFIGQLTAAVIWIYQKLIAPVTTWLWRFARWLFWKYHFFI